MVPTNKEMVRISVFAVKASLTRVEFARDVRMVPFGAVLPVDASTFVVKTQLTLLLLELVYVTQALDF